VRYLSDKARHLVCFPYSVEGLHRMARELGIGRHWFHKGNHAHYDIPKARFGKVQARTEVVSSKVIVRVCQGSSPDTCLCPLSWFKRVGAGHHLLDCPHAHPSIEGINDGFAELKADPKAWAEYKKLSDEWEAGGEM